MITKEMLDSLNISEHFKNVLIQETLKCDINILPVEPYYKVLNTKDFEFYKAKVDRMIELLNLIDDCSIQQSKIKYNRDKIPEVIELKKIKNTLNQYVLEYESLDVTVKKTEESVETETIKFSHNPLGFKVRKHTESLKSGAELLQVRKDLKTILSHLIVVETDNYNKQLSIVETNEFYHKCVNDYELLKNVKNMYRKELNNIKRTIGHLKVAPKCVLFTDETRELETGNIQFIGIQWVSPTYKNKHIITY